jgi:SAM-dependent methyltransferase
MSAPAMPSEPSGPHEDSDDTRRLISTLDAADAMPGVAELRARSHTLLAPTPGACVVDVGCGTGRAVAELNQQGVQAIGVDIDEAMLTVA